VYHRLYLTLSTVVLLYGSCVNDAEFGRLAAATAAAAVHAVSLQGFRVQDRGSYVLPLWRDNVV
jgi:hypothetical protein